MPTLAFAAAAVSATSLLAAATGATTSDPSAPTSIPVLPPPDGASDAEFSFANVCGAYIAISLALLTQPSGTFQMELAPSTAWYDSLLAGSWRLNPLWCASEALYVFGLLLHALVLALWEL